MSKVFNTLFGSLFSNNDVKLLANATDFRNTSADIEANNDGSETDNTENVRAETVMNEEKANVPIGNDNTSINHFKTQPDEQTSDIVHAELSYQHPKDEIKPPRKVVRISKIGSDHTFANMNNHDFAFNLLNMKVVTDGCGSGKHSEVGTKIFAQLFARKAKEYHDRGDAICEENFVDVVNEIFEKMLGLCNDSSFIFQNYCFTILICFEIEEEFVVLSCGDGYIIKENAEGISFEELTDGEYPAYYVYNFIEDKSELNAYQDGVSFKVNRYSKEEFSNVGVATDGLRFYEKLWDAEKIKLFQFLHDGKGPQIEKLINRSNRERNGIFHDDISICF